MDSAASEMIFLGVIVVTVAVIAIVKAFAAQRKVDEEKEQQKTIKEIQKRAVSSPPKTAVKDYSNAPKPKQQSADITFENQSYIEHIFPERLNNKQKLYKTYDRMSIDNVSLNPAEQLSFSEPLRLTQSKNGSVSLYYKNKKIGEVSSRGQDMTNQFLSRGDTVAAFISYVSGDYIKVSYGYYRDYRKNKTTDNMPSEKELFEYIRDNTKLSLTIADKTIELPLMKDNKSVCFIENNYNICVITTDEPDYSKLVAGDELTIVREPDNAYDKNAIKIMRGDMKIGYFFAHNLQAEVNQMLADGAIIKAYLTQITPKDRYSKLRMTFVAYK